ncbi:MAG: DUF6789 family protein [Candidatus Eisenbacteria bacterium]
MKPNFLKALGAGIAGTLAMTAVMWMAPRMGMPPMDIGHMLGSVMGGNDALGWTAHFMIGILLAVVYAAAFAGRLPGAPVLRGVAYSLGPWLMAQLVVMPMMGMGLFSGSMMMAAGSLVGHVVYGAVLGGVYGRVAGVTTPAHAVPA